MTPRNLIIEAGAGTGKTTRLVKAVIDTLITRKIPLEAVVALTFTNKAAAELRERVALALDDIMTATRIDDLRQRPWWPSPGPQALLSHLQALAEGARSVLDRAQIGTIHSFAFSILRRFPLASGINPEAQIDDKGLRFEELFEEAWPRWLAVELGDSAPRAALWKNLLLTTSLAEITEATRRLCDFDIPLSLLPLRERDAIAGYQRCHEQARALVRAHGGTLNADRLAAACEQLLGLASAQAWERLDELSQEVREALALAPGSPKAWDAAALETLAFLTRVARSVLNRSDRTLEQLTEAVRPFVIQFRSQLLAQGCLTHASLLSLCRDLVRDHPEIRRSLKRDIRMILIDEFQDTDPRQAELLLFLCEQPQDRAAAWLQIRIEPGKLFIVGDPKQSIYRFRGADIAAYDDTVNLLVTQGGQRETLAVNYRTQAQILDGINTAFEKLIEAIPGISPPYAAVQAHHSHRRECDLHGFELWLADSKDKQSTEQAQATEASAIAAWIDEHVGRLKVQDPREGPRPLTFRDIVLIFRTYSPMDRFLEALRRRQIPFAVESERYFFTTPEVTDILNLLRAAANPDDDLSLVGFLRGPLAGLTDDAILQARQSGCMEALDAVQRIRRLSVRLKSEPLCVVLEDAFREFFVFELGSRSYHGDQTVANLMKLKRLLDTLSRESHRTLEHLLKRLEGFFADDTVEGENPLADESYDAVRLLTVHKAKGLEFPVVFLPSLHSESRRGTSAEVTMDWRSGRWGMSCGEFDSFAKHELDRMNRRREAAEEDRILYVAMTRARERLILSGGIHLKTARSGCPLQRLAAGWGVEMAALTEGDIQIGNASLAVRKLTPANVRDRPVTVPNKPALPALNPDAFAAAWKMRNDAFERVNQTPVIATPSSFPAVDLTERWSGPRHHTARNPVPPLPHDGPPAVVSEEGGLRRDDGRQIGTLVHRFLQYWDFSCQKCDMPASLRRIAGAAIDPELSRPEVIDEAQKILAAFIGSPAYREIAESQILGREIPFVSTPNNTPTLPQPHTPTPPPLLRGVIDLLYRRPSGTLVVADFKTDFLAPDESLETMASLYKPQLVAYGNVIYSSLGERPQLMLILTRHACSWAFPHNS